MLCLRRGIAVFREVCLECRCEGLLLCAAGIRGFGDVVNSNELVRGFGSSRGTLLVVIAQVLKTGTLKQVLKLGTKNRYFK